MARHKPLPRDAGRGIGSLDRSQEGKQTITVRFDDRLNTVLAQPAANPHDRAVRWRQLVELLARASDLTSPLGEQALQEVRREASTIDEQVRAAAARAIARPQLPAPLVAAFAADSITVAAPCSPPPRSRPTCSTAHVLEEASAESRASSARSIPSFPKKLRQSPRSSPRRTSGRKLPRNPPLPRSPRSATCSRASSASGRSAKLERPPARAPHARPEGAPALFRWECGPSGEIAWVDGVPRGALIGRSIASPGEQNGLDQKIVRAFGLRAPFREAKLTVAGQGLASGDWKLSGVRRIRPRRRPLRGVPRDCHARARTRAGARARPPAARRQCAARAGPRSRPP